MKKSLFKVIIIITTLLMVAGCPDPVKGQKTSSGNRPAGGGTSPSAAATVNYTVKHMKQNVSGNGYTEDAEARQTLSGRAGASTAAQARSYAGFTAQTFSQTTIAANGSTVVTINYNRNVHSVSYSATTSGVTAPAAASYRFGAQVTVEFPTGISAWRYDGTTYSSSNNTFTMPDSDVILSEVYMISSNNVAETLSALGSNNADTPYTLIVSDSADLAAITEAIISSSIYVTLSLEDCEGLTSLPDNAFQNCDNLTSLVIPETVTSVGSDIFSGCTNLESVTFAGSVSSSCVADIIDELPQGAVIEAANTDALDSIIQGINATNSSVSLSLEHCTGLTSLDDGMFQNCDNLASITLPDNLESIGNNAFEGCTGLSSIAIPETVTSVGTGVFTGCSNLDTVSFAGNVDSDVVTDIIASLPSCAVIEAADTTALTSVVQGINSASSNVTLSLEDCEGLTSLADNAFQGCNNLASITLPASVTSISNTAFSGCSDLVSINVPAGNSNYSSANGVLLNNNGTTLICCPEGKTSVSVPSTVTSIGNNAFNGCTGLESIVIPDSVISVGTGVFNGCTNIESVTLPGTLNSTSIQNVISSLPAKDADSSYSIEITNVTTEDKISDLKTAINSSGKFVELSLEHCTELTSLPNNAFKNCNKVTSISLPSSVTSIGISAFSHCSSLESITIPSSVTSIGESAFYGCSALQSIDVSSGNNYFSSVDGVLFNKNRTTLIGCPGGKTIITIPSSVTSIGESAFSNCSSLESITIPSSVTSLGASAFKNCTNLESIELPSSVISIGRSAFYGCTSLQSISIPSSVTSIGESAFSDCSSLESITIPSSVTSIGDDAFTGCGALQSITIPSSVTSIGSHAFSVCISLVSITIPSSVTSIDSQAFRSCFGLESIDIPSSVTSIDEMAFYDCTSLQTINFQGTISQWSNINKGFWWNQNCPSTMQVKCRDGTTTP